MKISIVMPIDVFVLKTVEENTYKSLAPYEVPAKKENDLYAQIDSYNIKSISREQIK